MKPLKENLVFFKSAIKAPLKIGAFLPSSKGLADLVSRHVACPGENGYVLEIGAGTGSLTKALLRRGIHPSRLLVLEMQPTLAKFLRNLFPDVRVLEGDARDLRAIMPAYARGNVSAVVSGIPMVNLRFKEQRDIVEACGRVLTPLGRFLQFTYRPGSPLPAEKLGMRRRYLGAVLMNVPPAYVWEYSFLDGFNAGDAFVPLDEPLAKPSAETSVA